jgi:hypothetical protein
MNYFKGSISSVPTGSVYTVFDYFERQLQVVSLLRFLGAGFSVFSNNWTIESVVFDGEKIR